MNRNTTGIQCKAAAKRPFLHLAEKVTARYNNRMLGAGLSLYAVGGGSP
jgi:hypothetical protein